MHRYRACRPSHSTIERRIDEAYHKERLETSPTPYDFAATAVHALQDVIGSIDPKHPTPYASALRLVAGILHATPAEHWDEEALEIYKDSISFGSDESLAYRAMMSRREQDELPLHRGTRRMRFTPS